MNKFVEIIASGHRNILATHKTTWQITREKEITKKGDCIIGVGANVACNNLPVWLKNSLKLEKSLSITLSIKGKQYTGYALGHSQLSFQNNTDIVFRKSNFISGRTVGVNCTFAAIDLPSQIRASLKFPQTQLNIKLEIVS